MGFEDTILRLIDEGQIEEGLVDKLRAHILNIHDDLGRYGDFIFYNEVYEGNIVDINHVITNIKFGKDCCTLYDLCTSFESDVVKYLNESKEFKKCIFIHEINNEIYFVSETLSELTISLLSYYVYNNLHVNVLRCGL